MNFKKDIGDLYEEMIEEGSHGDKAKVWKMIKQAISKGLVRLKDTKNGWMLLSLVDDSKYTSHRGETGLHDLRRYLQNLENVRKNLS